jgi:serine/threonine protein phosphatase PrpC
MRKKINLGNITDTGLIRSNNEDYFGAYEGPFGDLIIVSDGVGGNEGGEIASQLAVQTVKQKFEDLNNDYNEKEKLTLALQKAHDAIKEKARTEPDLEGMGATAVVLLIINNEAFYAHIGDSRIYLIRDKQIHQLTKDHSLVQQMVDSNILTPEETKEHPMRNVILKALGTKDGDRPDVSSALELFKGDIFVLCSDGLTEHVEKSEILLISLNNPTQAACQKLVQLAKERGGKDNITIQIVQIKE